MSQTYFTILTNLGAAKLAEATASGAQLKLTHLAVGDGNGNVPSPLPTQTQLIHEVRRSAINTVYTDENNENHIIIEQVIPPEEGGFYIRELGVFDEKGNLIAVGNCPPSYKPKLSEGSGRTQVINMVIMVDNTGTVELKIDASTVLATRKYVDDLISSKMTEHEKSTNHPDASTTKKGFVQLNSAINSTLENQAATPKAVKTAYDLANTANTTANTAKTNAATAQTKADSAYTLASTANTTANTAKSTAETDASTTVKGRVQLNSAVNSTVDNQAATPKAVKMAYDLANTANTNASTAQTKADSAYTLASTANTTANTAKSTAETDASTTVKGRVQLNSAVNNTVENQAATPKAVKTAYDLANTANTTANTAKTNAATAQTKADSAYTLANTANTTANSAKSTAETDASTTVKGRVQLNSAVNSTVENQAATPKAVKTAYDLAVKATQKAYITDVFKSSDSSSWYRKWSDGFIEQGGYANITGSVKTINLLTPMNTVQYRVNANNSIPESSSGLTSLAQVIGKKTTTQFLLLCGDNSAISYGVEWMVRGY